MFWRIVGAVLSLTFFATSFSIWGDPTCRSVTMHGGRFGIAYTCLEGSGGTSANGFAWVMFFIGLVLLTLNLWPYIRVWLRKVQVQHQESLVDNQAESSYKRKSTKALASEFEYTQHDSKDSMRPTNCENCDKKLTKTSKYCQNCGEPVIDSELFAHKRGTRTQGSSGTSDDSEFKNIGAFALIGLIIAIVIGALVLSTQNSQVTPTPLPTDTPDSYSMSEVLADAGDGFSYVNDGFAMKWDNSESCTGFTGCVWVQVYSMEECTQLSFSLTFTDDANKVVGKDFQTGSFGLASGETGKYELEWLNGAEFVQMDDITCMWRP